MKLRLHQDRVEEEEDLLRAAELERERHEEEEVRQMYDNLNALTKAINATPKIVHDGAKIKKEK